MVSGCWGAPIKNPILHTGIGLMDGLRRICPSALDLTDETGLVGFATLLNLAPFRLEVCRELRSVPFMVRSCNFSIPVVLHQILQVLAVSWSGIGNIVV